jgi:YD repeat-containing protein
LYLANSPLVGQIAFANNGAVTMTTTKQYDFLNRLKGISSSSSSSSSFSYAYNSANQRTQVTNTDTSYWSYQYDKLGQVISGKKYWANVGGALWQAGVDVRIGRYYPTAWAFSDPKRVGQLRVVWSVKTEKLGRGPTLQIVLTQPLKGKPGARPPIIGDVVTFGTAHVGINLGHGIYISATSHEVFGQKGVVIKDNADRLNLLYRSPDQN